MNHQEICNYLAEKILDALKKGSPPWRSIHNRGMPTNPETGKRYNGINPLVLDSVADERNYRSKYWATLNQWSVLDIKIGKNPKTFPEWGTNVVNWKPFITSKEKNDIISLNKIHLLQSHVVFNAEQCYGKTCGKYIIRKDVLPDYSKAKSILDATNIKIEHNNNVSTPIYEYPPVNRILLPDKDKFVNEAQYWATSFHEMFHWSEYRLGWAGPDHQRELVAEIATGYLESELGLPHDTDLTNHEKWLKKWIEEIEKNPKYLLESAAQAARALDYVLTLQSKFPVLESE